MTEAAHGLRGTPAVLALCLALSVATGLIWELQNDEGVSFSVAVGELHLDGGPKATPLPVVELYAMLDGRDDLDAAGVIAALRNPDQMTHPPGFYLALNAWSALAGTRPLPQRVPAYLLGLLSVLAVGALARRLVGTPRAALAAMALMAVSPWFHGVSNFLRPYAPALCLGLWATLAVASARPGPLRAPWRVAFVLLSAAGLYVVYHYAFVLLWHGVALLVLALRAEPRRRLPELLRLAAMTAGVALLFAPWVPTLIEHMSLTGDGGYFWKDPTAYAAPWPRAGRLLQRMALGEVRNMWGSELFAPALTALGVTTALMLAWSFRRAGRPPLSRAASVVWATAPVYLALLVVADLSRGASTAFISKYVFMLFPLLLLLVVRAGVGERPRTDVRAGDRSGARAPGDSASIRARGSSLRLAGLSRLLIPAWLALLLAATVTDVAMRARLESDHEFVARVVAAGDDPAQLVLLSSIESRFAVPLVLSLREAGVSRSLVGSGPGEALLERVSRALKDPALRRLVLVRFDGTTPENAHITTHAYDDTWTPGLLERVVAQSQAAGWALRRGLASDGPPALTEAGSERVLILIDGVRTKRFHGHY